MLLMDSSSAFGHPLGCTGARQVVTALSELRRQNKRVAVTSMCVGTVSVCQSLSQTKTGSHRYTDMNTGDGNGRCICIRALIDPSEMTLVDRN